MYVPERSNPSDGYSEPSASDRLTITVHPPANTKRPVGFAPWPEVKPKHKPKKRK